MNDRTGDAGDRADDERRAEVVGVHRIRGVPVAFRRHRGPGDAVVLLHGGLSDGRVFDPLVAGLDADLDVWTYDRRGHGHTPDTDEPFGFADMLAEATVFLREVVGRPAHLVGHSDGAGLALLLAAEHPHLVRSVSSFSANTDPSGLEPGTVTVEELVEAIGTDLAEVSPHPPEHAAVVAAKAIRLWATEPRMTDAQLTRIDCPVLVAAGERDTIRRAHTTGIAAAIPGSRLWIVPRTTHMVVEQEPARCAAAVLATIRSGRDRTSGR